MDRCEAVLNDIETCERMMVEWRDDLMTNKDLIEGRRVIG
jgi:hypothetical protein